MAQELKLKIKGLWTAPNNWSEVPEGALKVAENVSISDDSVLRSRRGQARYGAVQSGAINKVFNYGLNHIAQVGDDVLVYNENNTTSWVSYLGSYTPPDGWKMRSVESNQNFYFTTDEGIKKIDDVTIEPFQAGMPPCPMVIDDLSGVTPSPGWLTANSSVSYRALFGYRDANENLILGPPSQPFTYSSGGVSLNPRVRVYLAAEITVGHFVQVYRTATVPDTADPGDEMQLVFEGFPTSTDVTNGYLNFIDIIPDDLRGVALYTNPSQEGIEASNFRPPLATDVELFKGCAFYANTTQAHELTFNLISTGETGLFSMALVGAISTGSPTITGIADTTGVHIGMVVRQTSGVPSGATVLSFTGTSITLNQNATATNAIALIRLGDTITIDGIAYWAHPTPGDADPALGEFYIETAGAPGQNIEATARNLVLTVNTYTANTTVDAYYASADETLPGSVRVVANALGTSAFTVDSTSRDAFSPELPQTSEAERSPSRLYFSKFQQPESVPLAQYFDIGSQNFEIQRIIASGDSLFVFKQDGIFRIIGQDTDSFRVSALDNTAIINGPETAVSVNNQVVLLTSQGVVGVTDSGVQVLSRPIEDDLLVLTSDSYQSSNNYRFTSFGVGYETERTYTLWLPATKSDDFPTVGFVYNFFTQAWTTWTLPRSCGMVSQRFDQLLMGVAGEDQTALERKEYDETDFADEEYAVTVNSVAGASLTLANASDVSVGYTIVQGANESVVTAVVGNVVTVEDAQAFTTGAATVYTPIPVYVEWQPIAGKNPGVNKHFKEMTMFFRLATFDTMDLEISNSFSRELSVYTIVPPIQDSEEEGSWGSEPWGAFAWGGGSGVELRPAGPAAIRTLIPLKSARALWVAFSLSLNQALRSLNLTGMSVIYDNMSTRFR